MLELTSTTMVAASAAVAALALVLVLFGNRRPKRAEKWEKAEIMKQLLALSDREESMQRMKQAMKARTSTPLPVKRQVAAASSTPTKVPVTAPVKSKANVAAAGKGR